MTLWADLGVYRAWLSTESKSDHLPTIERREGHRGSLTQVGRPMRVACGPLSSTRLLRFAAALGWWLDVSVSSPFERSRWLGFGQVLPWLPSLPRSQVGRREGAVAGTWRRVYQTSDVGSGRR
jgi:hypothetical protein